MPGQAFDPLALDLGATGSPGGPEPGDYLRFALGALRRRRWVALTVLLGCLAAVTAYYWTATPQYRAETRILAQRQQSLPSIVRSNVAEDQPTRAAHEIIHRRENLLALLEQSGALEGVGKQESHGPVARIMAWIAERRGEIDDPVERLVLRLDKRLKVEASDVTVAIQLDWPDAMQSYRIVDGALQNFLEARHVQEVTALDEAIAILRGRAAVLRTELERVTAEETRSAPLPDAVRAPRHRNGVVATARSSAATEEAARVRSMLDAKTRAIADVEDFRRRRLAELQAQYESRRAVLAEGHPEMASLRSDIAALSRESPQIASLRVEEAHLRREYQSLAGRGVEVPATSGPASGSGASSSSAAGALAAPSDSHPRAPISASSLTLEQAERIRDARSRYQEVIDSVNRAQLDLDTTRSAFKHRYKVIWPVQVPRRPVSPDPLKIFGIGGLASVLLAIAAAVALDWRSGRILERWQVERVLCLPVLGELHGDR